MYAIIRVESVSEVSQAALQYAAQLVASDYCYTLCSFTHTHTCLLDCFTYGNLSVIILNKMINRCIICLPPDNLRLQTKQIIFFAELLP